MAHPIIRWNKISNKGIVGALLSFSLVLSFFRELRIPVAGTLMHPYLLLLIPLAVAGSLNLFQQKRNIQITLFFYAGIFSLAQIVDFNLGEVLKIFAGIFIFFFFTKVVQNEEDFKLSAFGFIFAALFLSLKIIFLARSGDVSILAGVDALEETGIGNKNSQSQYILPGFFFICFFFSYSLKNNIVESAFWSVCILIITAGVAFTGNRSGYLGILIVILILIANFRISFTTVFLVLFLFIGGYFIVENLASEVVEHKLEQTTDGKRGDTHRRELLFHSVTLGFEYPLLGLGLTGLCRELAKRVDPEFRALDPHNLYGYLLGGGGVFVFTLFFRFLYLIFNNTYNYAKIKARLLVKDRYDNNLHIWIIGFIILFLVRSLFTRELIYSPHFMGGLGLVFSALIYYRKRLMYEVAVRQT